MAWLEGLNGLDRSPVWIFLLDTMPLFFLHEAPFKISARALSRIQVLYGSLVGPYFIFFYCSMVSLSEIIPAPYPVD